MRLALEGGRGVYHTQHLGLTLETGYLLPEYCTTCLLRLEAPPKVEPVFVIE